MNITPKQLKAQYNQAKKNGWLPWFAEAAEKAGTTTAHFLAIASRETNIRNIRGDFRGGKYHGYGPMQVDIGTDAEFAKRWTPDDPQPGIKRGGEIYAEKVQQIIRGQGKRLSVKSNRFTGREARPDDIRRIATAAYNSGLWAYFHFSNHAHIDSTTTGKDYSRDVYRRALEFAELLEADGEAGAFAREVELMGKYATEDDKARVFQKPSVISRAKEEPKLEEPKEPEPAAPQINVEHADQVKTDTPAQPIDGGRKDDDPKQASQGGTKSTIATILGVITGVGTAVKGVMAGNSGIIIVGIVCATVVILTWMFRQFILDYLRMRYMSDPTKINVK